jgi:hypothetical protein
VEFCFWFSSFFFHLCIYHIIKLKLTTLSILILFFSFSIYDELFRVEKWRNSMICFLHLWLKFQKEHKTNLWLSRISSFESVVKVYVELPSVLWMPNFLCSGSLHNVIYTQNNIVRGLVGCDNNLFVMEERRVFNNIWVHKYWCRASAHIPTEFFNSALYQWPNTLHPFRRNI